MSNRGNSPIFNESDSDSLSSNENIPSDNEYNTTNSNYNVNIRPATLILNNTSSNINNINTTNEVNNLTLNMATPAHNATAIPISEIKEYLEMVPIFKGEPELLVLFITESEKIINYFYDANTPNSPRNDFITSRIRAKVQGEAALYIANQQITSWVDLRKSLITAYADKRDDATLAIEMVKLEQGNDSPFDFYKKIQKTLNAQMCYSKLTYGENAGLIDHFKRVALKTLLNGLKDPLGSLMRTKDPQDLETALNLLTNTYQKEINSQRNTRANQVNQNRNRPPFQKHNNFNSTFSPSFMATPANFSNNHPNNSNFSNNTPQNIQNSSYNNNFGNNFNRALKRPVNSSQINRQQPTFSRNNFQETPMSISTNNTYRPPMKSRPPNNYNMHETFELENDVSHISLNEEDNYYPDESETTPYNNFLEEEASTDLLKE